MLRAFALALRARLVQGRILLRLSLYVQSQSQYKIPVSERPAMASSCGDPDSDGRMSRFDNSMGAGINAYKNIDPGRLHASVDDSFAPDALGPIASDMRTAGQ